MLDAERSHLDVTWVSQSLYSGPLSNPDFFLSLIAGRIRQVVLYLYGENKGADQLRGYREADLRLCFRICKMLNFS